MKLKQFVLVVSLVLIITGCFDDNSPPVYEDIEGVVLSNGEPLANIDVHIRNHFDPGGFIQNEEQSTVQTSFQQQDRDLVTGKLFKNGSSDPYATFFKDTLNSGTHNITIPDSLLMNGIIAYEVRNSLRQLTASLFVVNKPDSLLPGRVPFTQTDTNGEFLLEVESVSVGQSFRTAGGGGFSVTDSLQLIFTEGENILGKKKVRVLPDQSNYFEITID